MGSYNYGKSQATALKMMAKFGQSMNIERTVTQAAGNPWEQGTTVTTSYPVIGVVSSFAQGLINGDTVKYGDRRVLVAAKGMDIVPQPTDILRIGAESYVIIMVTPSSPAGTDIIYELQARK